MSDFSGQRVLLVEDEAMVAMATEDMLTDMGATVVGPATTLEAGLELANNHHIDVAILDVNLNGRMSFPIADRLRDRGVPFMFVTGYDKPDYAEDVPLLNKPINEQRFFSLLGRLIGHES